MSVQISMADIRKAGHCARMRGAFRDHGLDAEFRTLVKGGTVSSDTLMATGDPRAIAVVRLKLERDSNA